MDCVLFMVLNLVKLAWAALPCLIGRTVKMFFSKFNCAYLFKTSASWTGFASSVWNNDNNWAAIIVPTGTVKVNIPDVARDPIIGAVSTVEVCNNLTIEGGAVLTISANNALTVNGNPDNSAEATGLVIKSDEAGTGSLMILGSTSASGTVERRMSPTKWHIVSAPAIENLGDFLTRNKAIPYLTTNNATLGMMDYTTTSNSWDGYYTTSTSGSMEIGMGYLVRTATLTPSSGETTILDFQGTLNMGTKNVAVSLSGLNGWNCIGNLNIIGLPNLTSGLYLLNINDKGTPQTINVMVRK